MLEFEIQRCSRQCAATGKQLEPGEEFYSVLKADGGEIVRLDYSAEAWSEPPQDAIGWWKSVMPLPDTKRTSWAPAQVLIDYFDELSRQGESPELYYVFSLFLLRRKLLTMADDREQEDACLKYYCPLNEQHYQVPVCVPAPQRIEQLEQELEQLLYAGSS